MWGCRSKRIKNPLYKQQLVTYPSSYLFRQADLPHSVCAEWRGEEGDAEMLRVDAGRYLGFARLVDEESPKTNPAAFRCMIPLPSSERMHLAGVLRSDSTTSEGDR